MSRTVAVRFAVGTAGEARRQAHLAIAPERGIPDLWETYCGLEIPSELAEVSIRPAGMPCLGCLAAPGSIARALPGPV